MLGKAPTPMIVAGLLAFGVVLAMPLAGAFAVGVDATGIAEVKNAGATPRYGQTWIGPWMKHTGWSAFDRDMATMRDQGVTPVVMWYYWGDSISVNCVKYSCDGRSRDGWYAMMWEMISHIKKTVGDREVVIVMEPEFNKNGIAQWEDFDGYLADQERQIKAALPNAKIAVGFGHWGGWDLYDRAAAAADYTGFQLMRGSTRDSSWQAVNAADEIIKISQTLKNRFGKPIIVFDYAIASYGGWEWAQEKSMQNVVAKRGQLDAAGVEILVWRYVRDNDYSSGYYGAAESTWGAKRADGSNKPVWDDLLALIRGSSSGSAPAPAPAPSSGSTFSEVKGNEWWMQTKVAGNPTGVTVRVNGGSPVALQKQWWGGWTVGTHLGTNSIIELRATYPDGTSQTGKFNFPSGTPASSSGFDATITGVKGNRWWVQADVKANEPLAGVDARVNGGSWVSLTKQDWGAWAKSIYVPAGAKVEIRARSTTGASEISAPAYWG